VSSERPRHRLDDILNNVAWIRDDVRGMTYDDFQKDRKTQDAVLHCLLRISEAAKKLGDIAEQMTPAFPWRAVRDLGNVLRHEYDGVDLPQIWSVVVDDLGRLEAACQEILARLPS
jgi:uncharacterized protein with HEPN domain